MSATEAGKLRVLPLYGSLRVEEACLRDPVFKSDLYEFYDFKPDMEKCRKEGRLDMGAVCDRIIAFVEENKIDIVLPLADEMTLLQGVLSKKFPQKFRGSSLESSVMSVHKFYTRELLDPNPIPFCSIELDHALTEDELDAKAAAVGFPAFLKPYYGTNSALGQRVNSREELAKAVENARIHYGNLFHDYSPFFANHLDVKKFPLALKEGLMLEKYMDVPQKASVDGYVFQGKVTHWAMTDWSYWPNKPELPQQLFLPSAFPEELQQKIWQKYDAIAQRLIQYGYDNQFLNMEFFLCADGDIRLMEINCRMAAIQVASFLHVLKPGPVEALLEILQGKQPKATEFTGKHSSYVYLSTLESGKVSDIIDVEVPKTIEYMTLGVDLKAEIKVVCHTGTMLANAILFGDSREDIIQKHKELCARFFKKDPYTLGY